MEQKPVSRGWVHPLLLSTLLIPTLWGFPQGALAEATPKDLEAILQTREMALQAINTQDFSKVQPYLHPSFTITTVDNQVFHSAQEFEQYWKQQFTESVKTIVMELTGETTRTFLSPEIEVAYGEAITTFSFKDGGTAAMPLRWTAVLQKVENKWMIQTLHFSSSLLENPVLHASQKYGQMVAIGTGFGGLLLGAGIAWIIQSRLKRSPQQSS